MPISEPVTVSKAGMLLLAGLKSLSTPGLKVGSISSKINGLRVDETCVFSKKAEKKMDAGQNKASDFYYILHCFT